jgi:hypothetical protein
VKNSTEKNSTGSTSLSSDLTGTHSSLPLSLSPERQRKQHLPRAPWLIALLASLGLARAAAQHASSPGAASHSPTRARRWGRGLALVLGITSIPFLARPQRFGTPRPWGNGPGGSSEQPLQSSAPGSSSVTDALKLADIARRSALESVLTPVIQRPEKPAKRPAWRSWFEDRWLVATLAVACLASIASFVYFFATHQILLYIDAYSHMTIARRLFDNATPGLAQLGGAWLPLPHLLMLPFIWNDTLWRSGLAGSIPSMICYVVATIYLFLSARRLTHDSRASFVGTLLFILNPNILYLQSTPMSELVLVATLTSTAYYFLCWAQEGHPKDLIWAAACTFLATMARYDGWFLFGVALLLIPLVGWLKHQRWAHIEGHLLMFGTLGGLGILLWFLWCAIIFGDPLYFQHGPYSAQAQQEGFIQAGTLYTYHDLWQSIRYYLLASLETIGPLLFVLSIAALIVLVLRHRLSPTLLAASLFLTPIPFYVLSLYTGQAILSVPAIPAQLTFSVPGVAGQFILSVPSVLSARMPQGFFNARYGAQSVAGAALLLAVLASSRRPGKTALRSLKHLVLVGAIAAQVVLTASGGIISLQDGQQTRCTRPFAMLTYLAEHYNGGKILEDFYVSQLVEYGEAGIDFKDIIYEGSNDLWKKALANPATMVDWIVANPTNPRDLVAQAIDVDSPTFRAQFTRVVQEPDGTSLFLRRGLPNLPNKPLLPDLSTDIQSCAGDRQEASIFITPAYALADRDTTQIR